MTDPFSQHANDDEPISYMEVRCDGEVVASGVFSTHDLAVSMSLRWLVDRGPLAGQVVDIADAVDRLEMEQTAEDQLVWWVPEADRQYIATITDLRVNRLREVLRA